MGNLMAWGIMGAGVGALVGLLAQKRSGDRIWPELLAGAAAAPLTVWGLCEMVAITPGSPGAYLNTLSLLGACGSVVAAVVCHLACHRE